MFSIVGNVNGYLKPSDLDLGHSWLEIVRLNMNGLSIDIHTRYGLCVSRIKVTDRAHYLPEASSYNDTRSSVNHSPETKQLHIRITIDKTL